MILIFHLSKYFYKIYKLFLKSIIPEDFHGLRIDDLHYVRRLRRFFGTIFVKMNSNFLFGHNKRL